MPARTGEPGITGQQRRIQRFGESDVRGIVGSEAVTDLPDPNHEMRVRIPVERKVSQICQGLCRAIRTGLTSAN